MWSYNMNCVISAAGLCDINEGSATSEDRCKSPTSGNISFSVLLKSGINITEALCYLDVKPKQWTSIWMQEEHWLERKINVSKEPLLLIVFYRNCCSSNWNCTEGFFCWTIKLSGCQFHSNPVFRSALFEFITIRLWVFESIFPFVHAFFYHFAEFSRREKICFNLAWYSENLCYRLQIYPNLYDSNSVWQRLWIEWNC